MINNEAVKDIKKGNCRRCGRPLKTRLSLERGFGPSCYKKVAGEQKKTSNKEEQLLTYNAIADYTTGDNLDDYNSEDLLSMSFNVYAKNLKEANEVAFNQFIQLVEREGLNINRKSIYIWEITKDDLVI